VIPAFPVYLFDVDGTLVDSAADICGAIQGVLVKNPPKAPVDEAFLRRYIGFHLNDLFSDLFPGITTEELDRLVREYRTIYPARDHACTRVFPGVAEGLEKLGGRKSTATTKGTPMTRAVLQKFGLLPFFDHVQGTDGFPCKPEPDVVLRSLDVFQVRPEDCLLVGDAAPDMEAGRKAGVKICAVDYGYGNIDDMKKFEPDYWISDLRQLTNHSTHS
jgi:HAD superfamily hydrolase (TIGR01509 family)